MQNRVLPTGDIMALPLRGMFMGNRGILHDADGRMGRARWRHKAWVTCLTDFKGRKRRLMQPGRYTELFFLDEAVALAAGHRPCGQCRRADLRRFRAAWAKLHGDSDLATIDATLHRARVTRPPAQVTHEMRAGDLPAGCFIRWQNGIWLLRGQDMLAFDTDGYGCTRTRPEGEVTVLTPAPTVALIAAGYAPALHESAQP